MRVTPRQKFKTPQPPSFGPEVEELLIGLPVSERAIVRNGYRMRWHKEQKRYFYEHRLVMQVVVERELLSTEVVHHHNRDRTDNRPENLELIAGGTAGHAKHHRESGLGWGAAKGTPRPWQQKPLQLCPVCGQSFKPGRRDRRDTFTCSPACAQWRRYHGDTPRIIPCPICSAPFLPKGGRRTCSQSCGKRLANKTPLHGRWGYDQGCRCEVCRAAMALKAKRYRETRKAGEE